MNFIDIHGHYAWEVDDGISSIEECRKVLEEAQKQHISTIVATPHICCGKTKKDDIEAFIERTKDLENLASEYGIGIICGSEMMLNDDVKLTMDSNLFIPIGGTRYVLCEDDVRKVNNDFVEYFDRYVIHILNAGYRPIIAHAERYFYGDIDLEYIRYLVELGCIIQVNTTSILDEGSIQCKNAYALLENQLVHVIASDTHRAKGMRSPNMHDCYQTLLNKGYCKEYLKLMMRDNPENIVTNKGVIQPSFKHVKTSVLNQLLNKMKKSFSKNNGIEK